MRWWRYPRAREAIFATLAAIAVLRGLYAFRKVAFIADQRLLLTGAVLIAIPIFMSFRRREAVAFIDSSLKEAARSFRIFFIFTAAIFPLLAAGNHLFQTLFLHQYFSASPSASTLLSVFMTHLFFVALPEEFFFRGYLQDGLNAAYSRNWRVLGGACGLAWLLTALIFAVSHSAITVRWWHIFIFFPGLAFGWLREKSGTILAPMLFHAFSNTFAFWAGQSYRS